MTLTVVISTLGVMLVTLLTAIYKSYNAGKQAGRDEGNVANADAAEKALDDAGAAVAARDAAKRDATAPGGLYSDDGFKRKS